MLSAHAGVLLKGTQGLFAAIEARGNIYSGFAGAAAPGSGAMGDFDDILKQLRQARCYRRKHAIFI